jgi:hypothetical protein
LPATRDLKGMQGARRAPAPSVSSAAGKKSVVLTPYAATNSAGPAGPDASTIASSRATAAAGDRPLRNVNVTTPAAARANNVRPTCRPSCEDGSLSAARPVSGRGPTPASGTPASAARGAALPGARSGCVGSPGWRSPSAAVAVLNLCRRLVGCSAAGLSSAALPEHIRPLWPRGRWGLSGAAGQGSPAAPARRTTVRAWALPICWRCEPRTVNCCSAHYELPERCGTLRAPAASMLATTCGRPSRCREPCADLASAV